MKNFKISNRISQRDDRSVDIYFSEISRYNPLSSEEERDLSRRIKEDNDQAALHKLINSNLKFVVSVAKSYQSSKIPLSDLINEGNAGLMAAALKFDGEKGYKFISYAVWWIRQSIMKYIAEYKTSVRMPMNRFAESIKIYSYIDEKYKKTGEYPTDNEICEKLDINSNDYLNIIMCNQSAISFDKPIEPDSNNTLLDLTPSDLFGDTDDSLDKGSLKQVVEDALSFLNPRERDILKVKFGFDNQYDSYDQISERYGIGRERIKQLENYALVRLRCVRGIKNLRDAI